MRFSFLLFTLLLWGCSFEEKGRGIDRLSLVTRHNVVLNKPDTLGSLSVGNGEFAFTVDVSGLQSFPEVYENGIPLGTQSQWAWHSFPNTNNYKLSDVAQSFVSCDSTRSPYAVQKNKEASDYLRSNPHRLHLGQVGLLIKKENGEIATINDLTNIDQRLDLWKGKIESNYEVDGKPVKVTVYSIQDDDGIAAKIESPLLASGNIKAWIKFPYAQNCHTCAGYDWTSPDKHISVIDSASDGFATIARVVDSTRYFANITWSDGKLDQTGKHEFQITSPNETLELGIVFSRDRRPYSVQFEQAVAYNIQHWSNFWMGGAAIDLSAVNDPRASELERRIILSQYLTKIQCSGSLPPQETGLTMNSWYGKFHLEMYWWHAAHFALWNRSSMMSRSLEWYRQAMDHAKATASWQHYKGARWQKMTDPHGKESPSDIGAFIIWQQPHPIYLAELLYQETPDKVILDRYSEIVFETADFMASFVKKRDGVYHLCRPLMPAQEIFNATQTDDPTFELQYWRYALKVAQEWRVRSDMDENAEWNDIIDNLKAPESKNDSYFIYDDEHRKDHPSVLAAFGMLPGDDHIDEQVMKNTLDDIMKSWKWESTWGWDYPMMAMTAARLGDPEKAIDALMMDRPKNRYLVNGHNYQDKRLRLYLPGNGGLLAAVAVMAKFGFPEAWNVKTENFRDVP